MRKVEIIDPGDTKFLEKQLVDKWEFFEENDWIYGKKVIEESGDSQTFKPGQIVTARKLRDENSMLKRKDMKPIKVTGCHTCNIAADPPGYHPGSFADTKLYVSRLIPGNHQGAQRSCHLWQS